MASAPKAINVEEYNVPPPIEPAADNNENIDIKITVKTSPVVSKPGTTLNAELNTFIY